MDKQREERTGQPDDPTGKAPSFGQVVLSTLAAAIGVQSNRNRERDFQGGSIKTYIAAGIIFTALFVLTLALVVKTVLGSMG